MLKLSLVCIATCLIALCWSKSIQLEDKPGYCRIKDIYIKEGESSPAPSGSCNMITCNNAEPVSIAVLTCNVTTPRPGSGCSTIYHDFTKLYPDCCPIEDCSDGQKWTM